MANVNDKLKQLEEEAKKKANQEEVKKIQQSAQAVQQKLSSNPSAVGTVNNNTYNVSNSIKTTAGTSQAKTTTYDPTTSTYTTTKNVVGSKPVYTQQKAYNDVFNESPVNNISSGISDKLNTASSRAGLFNAYDTVMGAVKGAFKYGNYAQMNDEQRGYVNNLYDNKGVNMSDDEYKGLKDFVNHNAQYHKDEDYQKAKDLLKAYETDKRNGTKDNDKFKGMTLDTDSNGNVITDYFNDGDKKELSQLKSLYAENEEDEELKKKIEELEERKKKQEYADWLKDNENKAYINENYTRLTDEEKKAYLYDLTNRKQGISRLGKVLEKNVINIANTPARLFNASRDVMKANDLETLKDLFDSGEITKEEYDTLVKDYEKFDINSEDNISNKFNAIAEELNSQAYYGLNQAETIGLQAIDSTSNFLINFYALGGASSMLGFEEMAGTLITTSMSAQSGTDKYYQNIQNGYDPQTAMNNAVLTGILSYLSEQSPTENFINNMLNSKTGKMTLAVIMRNVLSQTIEEGIEEGIEYIVEPIIDSASLGTDQQFWKEYNFGDLIMAVGMGALSGAMLGMGSTYLPNITNLKGYNQLRADTNAMYMVMNDTSATATDRQVARAGYMLGTKALNDFSNDNKTMGALVKASDLDIETITPESANQSIDMASQLDQENYNRYARIIQESQNVLGRLGVTMDAREYATLSDKAKENVEIIQAVADKTGIKTIQTTSLVDADGNVVDGKYENGILYINPNGSKPALTTWVHELTHSEQFKADYPQFSEAIRKFNPELTARIENALRTQVDENGKRLYADDEIDAELDAFLAGELLSNDRFVDRLVNDKPTLASKIYNDLMDSITQEGSLRDIQNKFLKAFNNNNLNENTGLNKNAITDTSNPKYYTYDNLILQSPLEVNELTSSGTEYVKASNKNNSRNVETLLEKAKENFGVNKEDDLVIANNRDGKEILVDKVVFEHTAGKFIDNNPEIVCALENIGYLLSNSIPINNSFKSTNTNKNYIQYYNAFVFNDTPYISRFIVQNGKTSKVEITDLSNAYAVNAKKVGDWTSFYLHNEYGKQQSPTYSLSIGDLLQEINNIKKYKVDLPIDVQEKLGNKEVTKIHDKYTNLYAKKLNINSDEDANGVELSKNQKKTYENVSELLRDDQGRIKRYYHGTQRGDRVGNEFRPDRATAGPMSYFTDTKSIADNYSKDKADTSIQYSNEYEAYTVDGKDLDAYYNKLSSKDKNAIKSAMYDIGMDEDWENIVREKGANYNSYGKQTYDYYLRDNGNNPLYAMYRILEDNGDEGKFGKVLDLLNIKHEFDDPYASNPKTYEVYLNVTNPLDTNNIPASLVEQFRAKADELEDSFESNGNIYAWDKNAISPKQWMEFLDDDIANGRTHAWTIIPDFVTDILKQNGYDGVSDVGGKNGGVEHQVVIPFYANQIKNVDNINPTSSNDIRYSKKLNFDSNEDSDGTKLSSNQKKYFKDSKVTDENGNLMVMYHGTSDPNFTVFDPSMSDDGISLFFTNNPKVAETYSASGQQSASSKLDAYNLPKTIKTVQQYNEYAKKNGIDFELRKIDQNYVEEYVKDNIERENKNADFYRLNDITPKGENYYREIAESHFGDYIPFENGQPYGIGWAKNEQDLLKEMESDAWVGKFFGTNYPVYLNITNPLVVDGTITNKYENASIELDIETWEDFGEKKFDYNILDEDGSKIERKQFNSIEELMSDETFKKYVSDEEANRLYQEWMDKYNSAEDKKDWIHLKTETKIGDYEKQDGSNWKQIRYNNLDWSTRDLSRYAKDNGYDGLIMKNIYDIGGFSGGFNVEPSDVVVAFNSNQVKATNNVKPTSDPDIRFAKKLNIDNNTETDNELTISDEELSSKIKQPNMNTRMESMKKSFLENTDDWLPDVEFLRKNYPDFSEENINEASFEIFAFGDISDETKQKLADNIIATEFNGNEEQYNESNKTGVVDQFVNEAIERFATNTFYQQNKKKLDPVANKTNEYIKAFSGFEGSENVDSKFDKVSEMVKLENEIKETREASVDQTVTINTLFELGKDNISQWRTLEQNLDEVAGRDTDLRKQLQEMIELPRYQAQITNARILTEGKKFIEEYAKNGFASGSRESALAQYMLEGHTEEVVEWKKAKDGSTYPVYKSFNEDDLVKEVGREKADKIIEYSKQLRDRYDDLIYQINNARIQEIYGDVEVKNDLETMKLLAKVEQAGAVVEKLKQRMLNETNNPKLESMYQRAKANFNKLSAQYNTKVENDLSGDSTRRQLVPYRTNYAHHIVDKGNFFQQLAQAFKGEKTTPTALSGIADRSKPKSGFASFMMKQDSANYIPDATQGFIEYLQQSSKTIAYDPLINYYRNITNDMRALAKDNTMSKFVEYMDDYSNDLAGKTNEFDRGAKKLLGQKTFNVVKVLNSRVKPNALLFNVRSALVQAGNLPNALDVIISKGGAKGSIDVAKGTYNYLTDLFNKDAIANQSPFLTMRYDTNINNGDTSFMKSAEKFGAWMIGVLDESVTKSTWYSAYEQAQRMGVKDPIFYADDVTRRAVAGRDTGEVPLALKSELVNLAMPFQLEVQNVWNTMKGNARDKELGALMVALITSWLMNNAYDKLFGDRVLFDPIDAIVDGLQEEDKGQAVVTRLAGELVSAVPLAGLGVQQFMSEDQREKFFGEADPTRYGTQNISVGALGKALAEASQGNTIEPIATLFYAYGMPFGGTQAKRVIETLQSYGYLPKHVSPDPDSLSEFNEWEMSPINYSKKGKITYVNDDPFKSTDNFFDFAKQLAFGKHVGKGNQAYVDSGFKTMSDSQRTVFDAFNTKLSEYNAYQVTQDYKRVETLHKEDGKPVNNSKALQKRKILQDNGVWETYKESNEANKNDIGTTVYNMDNSDFQKAYNEAMSKAVDKPTEVTKVEPEQKKNESSLADYFNSVFGKKKEEKPTEEVVAKNTTTEETKVEETKEKPFNINDYDKDLANLDKSNSGHYYQKGTRGLESNQREVGQYRYYKQPDGTYDLQVWNGKKFETKAQNVDVTKVGKKKTNSSSSKKTSSKSTKTKAEREYESKKKKALAVLNGSSSNSFSNVEKILNSAIKNDTLDSTLSSMRSKFKSQYSSLIGRYLKAHPEARAMFK